MSNKSIYAVFARTFKCLCIWTSKIESYRLVRLVRLGGRLLSGAEGVEAANNGLKHFSGECARFEDGRWLNVFSTRKLFLPRGTGSERHDLCSLFSLHPCLTHGRSANRLQTYRLRIHRYLSDRLIS